MEVLYWSEIQALLDDFNARFPIGTTIQVLHDPPKFTTGDTCVPACTLDGYSEAVSATGFTLVCDAIGNFNGHDGSLECQRESCYTLAISHFSTPSTATHSTVLLHPARHLCLHVYGCS